MASISSLGVGSGLDLNGILQSLMVAEQQPLLQLTSKEASTKSKISGLGNLSNAMDAIATSAGSMVPPSGKTALDFYSAIKATVVDKDAALATVSGSPAKGSFSLEVIQLAQAHRIVSNVSSPLATSPVLDGAATSGSLTIEIGAVSAGVFTRKADTSAITINISATNNSLGGLRDAINAANAGVSATIVTGDNGASLVITSNNTGTGSSIKLSNTSNLSGFEFDPVTPGTSDFSDAPASGGLAAQNAQIKVNGILATSQSNTFEGTIDGLTLTAQKVTTTATSINISKDSTLSSALTGLVKTLNDSAKTMRELGQFSQDGTKTGLLIGNSTLRSVQSRLRAEITSPPNSIASDAAYRTLTDIGISYDKSGVLQLDTVKLNKAIEKDVVGVSELIAAVAKKLKDSTASGSGLPTIVKAASDGLNATVRDFGRQREVLNKRLDAIEQRYRKQFSAMDSLVANMNKTSSYLQQQLANLPKIGA